MKLSDYVWKYVEELGVRHVFMFPGGGAMHLVDSLGKNDRLQYVTLLHEQACAMAAETYARIDYNLGVALVTTGPGGTNAVTGVAAAWLESTPMLVISGQAKTEDLKDRYGVRQRGNQEIGIVDIVSSITKYAVTVKDPAMIRYHLDRAVYEAKDGRPGPVWLDIPLDIQAADIDSDVLAGYIPEEEGACRREQCREAVGKAAQLLSQAQRPVIIAGQGIERNHGKAKFRELVEKLEIPVLFSWIAVELLEYDHPCNLGKPGMVAPRYSNFTMQDADLIIAIGTRLDPAMIGYDPEDFAPSAKKVIVDIDENELNKFGFDIDLKIQADAAQFIEMLLEAEKDFKTNDLTKKWLKQCQEWRERYPVVLEEFRSDENAVNPYHFMDVLSDKLADDDVVIPGSSGAGIDVFWMCFKNRRDQRTLATGSLGSMGYGLPAAIGACLASGKRTICVEGDGSIQLNIQEFASIVGMHLPIKIFINGNNGYLSIMNMQRSHFGGHFVGADSTSHLYLPDIVKVAEAYGIKTFEVKGHTDLEEGIKKTLEAEGPSLCYVHMRNDISIQPKVMSRVAENGSMISGKLRDLWPFIDE
ncbi:MAG: thiamine pyrophosphate-binding protein [Bacteroidales bacterium]|nr:thiamine pyrophosphate-binding protein [Bacteroidales bacterium]MCM1414527.1 thiamine pyrophosphate-binding protein [bacterium]MCM1422577.1 thiamine pyrophosphate-binding protein [bacterium]